MIYRVMVRAATSMQPPPAETFWNNYVLYCGTDLQSARVHYLQSEATDFFHGYGNCCRETVIERFESEPEDISSTESKEVDL